MRLLVVLLTLSCVACAEAQNIGTRVLTPSVPIRVALSPALTTTLLFPGPLSGTFGLGLITGRANSGGTVQVEHPDGSNILVLHALSESARVLMTVLLEGKLYVFALESSPAPDVAVTLVREGSSDDPSPAPKAQPVTPAEVVATRPKYDPELLVGFLRRAHNASLLRKLYPDLYQGYTSRPANYTSDSGTYKTTVTQIHRFSKEDAIVLEGTVENETVQPLQFDGRAATVLCANEVHPIKLLDCLRPIPAGARVPIDVVIQGDIDGGRANLSADNEFRIELPDQNSVWSLKNGETPKGPVKMRPPIRLPEIPLTETGPAKKESQ